ncbi:MAG: molybdopterin-dependent oxidoreductase [Acidobacteria bacterium]|nr:molybdopterin-dependent oxidoreductase [Acidobacteriota bacterium]
MLSPSDRERQEQERRQDGRLPPGQSLTLKWPVLHEGPIPKFDPATWTLDVGGLVSQPLRLSWDELQAMPRKRITADFHCVTTWSKFDNEWEGVPFTAIAERAGVLPEAKYVIIRAENGYTTNAPIEDLLRSDVLLADRHAPEPLTPEHGGPLRLVVPHLYAWKSAKWLRGFELTAEDRPGYWEQVGYHMYGDPFREQRYRRQ